MRLSLSTICSHRLTVLKHTRWATMDSYHHHHRPKQKILILIGATGTGKSRLSIDIASHIPSEIINSDKIQLYAGLDITTNKISMPDRRGVPHHLLGEFDPNNGEVSAADYRSIANDRINSIIASRRLPIIAGGSNSFIHALISDHYDPDKDYFGCNNGFISPGLRYSCCFIWVDVNRHVLEEYLSRRVDDMLNDGMFEELAAFFSSGASAIKERVGLMKAIGVPEFERYFGRQHEEDLRGKREAYEEAVKAIKENTYELVERQIEKIQRLRSAGWDMKRMDATAAFRAVLESDDVRFQEAWEKIVMGPSMKIVKRFLGSPGC